MSNGNCRSYYTATITSYIVAIMIWIEIMSKVWSSVANAVRAFAVKGAGFRSIGIAYAPKVPDALK